MRETNMERLSLTEIPIENNYYLHYKYYHQDLFTCLKKYSSGRVVDIGCGNKPYLPVIKSQIDSYTGCDIVQSSKQCVDVICPANKIPLNSDEYDTIISTQTIEHVEDHQGLVNEAFRLLKPGGFFIVSGPMYWPLHEEPYDFFRITKYGFSLLLHKSGFEIVESKANGGKWALCGQVIIHTFYPGINNGTSFKWQILRLCFKLIGGVKGINKIFSKLEEKERDESNTMNYVFVAQKK
jgi:SAM-dependent methyltransferase